MKKNSFLEGTLIATFAIVLVKIIGMLYVIPFYALVGSKGSALYGYGYNIYLTFLAISSAGLPTAISKITNEYETLGLKEAKVRSYKLGRLICFIISIIVFLILFIFSKQVALLILGNLKGGNTIDDVSLIIKCVSLSILVVPFLSVSRGYLQGHKYITPSSNSQLIEQIVRVFVILAGSFLTIKVFDGTIKLAVAIAILGAFISGIVAYLYIIKKINNNKKSLSLDEKLPRDKITNKEIIKKIIYYAVPFIIINVAINIYNFVDMILILRTLNYLKFDADVVEFITSAISTWTCKINMIVVAIANGMVISLIPAIVSAFVLKKWKEVESKLNKALQIIILISTPMVVGLAFLATPVWTVFYGTSYYGPIVLRMAIINALFTNLYMATSSTLQGLNKYKTVYKATLGGFILNAILDVPMMLLFNKLGIYPFYGALVSTALCYIFAVLMGLHDLHKNNNISYKDTIKVLGKVMISIAILIITLFIIRIFIPLNVDGKLKNVLVIAVYTLIGIIVYGFTTYKLGLLNKVFGEKYLNKVIKKLTFGKVSKD